MKYFTKKNCILALYLGTLVVGFLFKLSSLFIFLLFLVYTLVLAIVYFNALFVYAGNYFMARGKIETAKKIFMKAIQRNTIYPTAYLNYGIILVREGDGAEALKHLEKALTCTPKVLTEKNIYLTMGSCYWVLGEIDKAIEVLEGMRTRYEYVNAHVLITLGYMYLLKGRYEEAMEATDKAIEDSPDLASAWDNRGQIHYQMGNAEAAKEAFEKAVDLKFNLVDSHYHLALIALESVNKEAAKEHIHMAKKCDISSLNTVTREQVEELCTKIEK